MIDIFNNIQYFLRIPGKIAMYTKAFGLLGGIRIFIQLKFSIMLSKLVVPGLKRPLSLRPGTTDVEVFKEIFVNRDYDIALNSKPQAIIDAGACIGLTSIFFANKYPQAKCNSVFRLSNRYPQGYPSGQYL